jgi:serine/threonine-protein kinase
MVDARCDIYALGCVLYELVCGSRPFEGSPVVVMGKQLRETPESPRSRSAAVPADIDAVIMKAISKSKDDRFASAREMREALEAALARPGKAKSRVKGIAAFAGIAAIAAFGAFSFRDRLVGATERIETTAHHVMEKPAPTSMTTTMAANVEPVIGPPPAAEREIPPPVPVVEKAAEPAAAPAPQVAVAPPSDDPVPTADEKKPSSLLQRASAHHQDAEVRSKLTEARVHAKENPTDAKALRAWAMAALSAGETREARRAAEAWSVHENGAEPRLVLAAAFEAANRHHEARAVLEEWLQNHPDTPEARKMLQRIGGGEPAVKHKHPGATTRSTGNASLEEDKSL